MLNISFAYVFGRVLERTLDGVPRLVYKTEVKQLLRCIHCATHFILAYFLIFVLEFQVREGKDDSSREVVNINSVELSYH